MVDRAIVAFLDILGYKKIVENHMNNIELIQGIETIIKEALRLVSSAKEKSDPERKDGWSKILQASNAKVISDSAIFTLSLSKISPKDNENISSYIYIYLLNISAFCLMFIGKTGHIFRGAVSLGDHYENATNGSLFIFSQAYINAFELERKEERPRIIIDNTLLEYLKTVSFSYTEEFFFKDKYGTMCFDLYCFLRFDKEHEETVKMILAEIKEGLTVNIRANIHDNKVMDKLKYFVEYHNSKITKAGENFKDFFIDSRLFEGR